MDTIKIQTLQNVEIEYTLANIGERILAWIVDILLILAIVVAFFVIMNFEYIPSNEVLIFLFFIPILMYDFLFEQFNDGQTPGKKLLKIKVIALDGTQGSLGKHFLRWLLRPIDIGISYGLAAVLTILINGKGQRLGDLVAGTSVVSLKQRTKSTDTVYIQQDENYEVTYPTVIHLTDKDVENIRHIARESIKRNDANVATALAEKVKSILQITSDQSDLDFLRTVVKDYSHLTSKF